MGKCSNHVARPTLLSHCVSEASGCMGVTHIYIVRLIVCLLYFLADKHENITNISKILK